MYIDKDGGAQCVADNEDDEREILPYPGTKSKSGDMEILRILQISSQSADGTKLKLCQESFALYFANSAGERTPIKAYRLYALLSLVRSLGKRYTRYHQKQWNLYKLQREEKREEIWPSLARKDSIPMFWKFIKILAVT